MPQIEQLPDIFFSQLFWLLLVFGALYFFIGKGMVPKIQSVVDARGARIAEDLAAAQGAREATEAMEEAYRRLEERVRTLDRELLHSFNGRDFASLRRFQGLDDEGVRLGSPQEPRAGADTSGWNL